MDAKFKPTIQTYIKALETNFQQGFDDLMRVDPTDPNAFPYAPDEHSTRAWLMHLKYVYALVPHPKRVMSWIHEKVGGFIWSDQLHLGTTGHMTTLNKPRHTIRECLSGIVTHPC